MAKIFFCIAILFFCNLFAGIPEWMEVQIKTDLAPFRGKRITQEDVERYFETYPVGKHHIYKIKIKNHFVSFTKPFVNDGKDAVSYRLSCILPVLKEIAKLLPDLTFYMAIGDRFGSETPENPQGDLDFPLFVMSRKGNPIGHILFPDFDALRGAYQVLPGKDITRFDFPWREKIPMLIWRGSPTQEYWMNPELWTRYQLCFLSEEYPDLIDAGFSMLGEYPTRFSDTVAKARPYLSFEEHFSYKYQLWIDGNSVAYTYSGWKFFTGSTIIKPDSLNMQWYFKGLQPYVNYVPVYEDLSNLVEMVQWLKANDAAAQRIGQNAKDFARMYLVLPTHRAYFLTLLKAYSELNLFLGD